MRLVHRSCQAVRFSNKTAIWPLALGLAPSAGLPQEALGRTAQGTPGLALMPQAAIRSTLLAMILPTALIAFELVMHGMR